MCEHHNSPFLFLEIGAVCDGLNSWVQVIILRQYPNSWNWRHKSPFLTPIHFLSISISSKIEVILEITSRPFSCLLSPPHPSSIAYLFSVTIYLCFTQNFYRQNDRTCMGSSAWVFWLSKCFEGSYMLSHVSLLHFWITWFHHVLFRHSPVGRKIGLFLHFDWFEQKGFKTSEYNFLIHISIFICLGYLEARLWDNKVNYD